MVVYEYPLNESIRTMLRLEHLFDRLAQVMVRDLPVDHHFALVTLFEIMDVASRADLKSDLLKELERHRQGLAGFRNNPHVDQVALDERIQGIDHAYGGLNQLAGKAGQSLSNNDWLMSVRSRISIPAGTCEFDLPAYFAWQQLDAKRRRADLGRWTATMMPVAEALKVLLRLLRDSGAPHKVVASAGQFQQSLPAGKTYQLLRLRIDEAAELVPEISGHRLMVSIRLMHCEPDGRLRAALADSSFELALCS